MKKFYQLLVLGFCLIALSPNIVAQPYGNEWINYSLKYYKIKVANDGIYRIDSITLAKAGINVATDDSRYYKIFYKGQEQYIYVNAQSSTNFSEVRGNYIEFYGQHNDASLDSLLYSSVPGDTFKFLPNPYFSLFNDSSTYYLTYDPSTPGKSMFEQTDTNYHLYTSSNYFYTTTDVAPNLQYRQGAWQIDGIFTINDARYTQSECWTDNEIGSTGVVTYNFPGVKNVYTGSNPPNAYLRAVVIGGDLSNGKSFSFSSNVGNLSSWTAAFDGFAVNDLRKTFNSGNVNSNNYSITFTNSSHPATDTSHWEAVSFISVNYPHSMNMDTVRSLSMYCADSSSGGKTYLDMTNFRASVPDTVRFYDLTNHSRMVVANNGTNFKVLIPNTHSNKQCFITSDSLIKSNTYKISKLIPVGHYQDGNFYNFTAITVTKPYLIITHPKLWTSVESGSGYAHYRQSVAGGGFQPIIADINEVYDQFGYGVDYCPLGIRNLCNYAVKKWTNAPQYLFLIGKGIHSPFYRAKDSTVLDSLVLVPSWGYPSSDILLTAGLDTSKYLAPRIPTGRIAAQSDADVTNYLNKVITYEGTAPALWQKKVIHFAGGSNIAEESYFANFLNQFALEIIGPLFGADMYNFSKNSPAPLTSTLSDSIKTVINGGVDMMTFFGHAAGNDFDFSLDYPTDYQNYNRYPFILADACFSGDIFQPIGAVSAISSTSEQWVLESPGAIGFLASDYLGNVSYLDNYSLQFYSDLDSLYYHKSIGQTIQHTIRAIEGIAANLELNCTMLEMTLHGDPAVSFHAKDTLPDYAVTDSSLYFTPAVVTNRLDSFGVHVIVSNYAEAKNQLVYVTVTRYFPNGTTVAYTRHYPHVYYQDTLLITMPVDHINGVGLNHFCVTADPGNLLPELTYSNNNYCGIPLLISSGDIIPVWPYDYAIYPHDTVTLKASTGDPFAPMRTYVFEIDTTDLFNSGAGYSQLVSNTGGVIMANPGDWQHVLFHGPVKNPSTNAMKTSVETMNANAQTKMGMQQNSSMTQKATGNSPKAAQSQISSGTKMQTATVNGHSMQTTSPASPKMAKNMPELKPGMPENKTMKTAHVAAPFPLNNKQVYYWRVRRDTVDGSGNQTDFKDYPWEVSSFEYLKGYTGWGQSEYLQFMDDEQMLDQYNSIDTNVKQRQWYFTLVGKKLQCNTFGSPPPDYNTTLLYATEYTIDNFTEAYAGVDAYPAIHIAIIDPVTFEPWITTDHTGAGNINTGYARDFEYWDNVYAQMSHLKTFMRDSVPNGYYILAWSYMEGYYRGLADTSVIGEFQALGSTQMEMHKKTPGKDTVPFIFFVQKGNPATVSEVYGRKFDDSIVDSVTLRTNGTLGSIVTPLIGPASKYDSLSWNQHPLNHSTTDSVRLNIIGVEPSGSTRTLMAGITPSVASMYISSINARLYPFIQLSMFTKDAGKRTPAQMNWWRVFYTPVPELAVNPNISTAFHSDTLQSGDTLRFRTTVQNISDYPMDSTLLHTWVMDQHYNTPYSTTKMLKKLNPGDTANLSMTWVPSNSYLGNNSVWFEVNPEALPTTKLEQFHFNNIAEKTLTSWGDKINPLLDVTFDGIHILNNDIVSPTPNILISLMDENKFLALNDPSDVQVYIRNITSTVPQPVPYGPLLTFTPAVEPHNKCSLLYTPTLPDGTYELSIDATDRSGNASARNMYKIDFQIINKSMISEVLNYPNPFSTSTKFVFILTGDKIPTTFKIQVMTVTGKIIKEITESEIGPIHIGRNITQYAWDGCDQFGSKLANGVYLYRVQASIDGQSIDNYATGADQYFTKNWGKMYIIR